MSQLPTASGGALQMPFAIEARPAALQRARRRARQLCPAPISLPLLHACLGVVAKARVAWPGEELFDAAPGTRIALRTADRRGRAVLQLGVDTAATLSGLALSRPVRDRTALAPAELGALLFALDRGLGDVRDRLGWDVAIAGPLGDDSEVEEYLASPAPVRLGFCLVLGDDRLPLALCLASLPEQGLGDETRQAPPRWVDEASILLSLQVGTSVLEASAVRTLAAGDLVVLDSLCHPSGRVGNLNAMLRAGRFALPVEWLDPLAVRVTASAKEGDMPNTVPTEAARYPGERSVELVERRETANPGTVDLPVELRVECGQLELTVAETSRLCPGDVLRLGRPVSAAVSLVVGRRRIGRGQLVEVEGELAVEVLGLEE